MQLAHKIRLTPTADQEVYFWQASGTARKTWNWALDEWNKQYAAGKKPSAASLKKQFNAIKYDLFPWMKGIHRDAHAQPFAFLGKAWNKFFSDIKAGKKANEPQFKKKGKCKDSFYVANDKFRVDGFTVVLPIIGKVIMTEKLRFQGKIMSGTVSRTANKWFLSIQVDVPESQAWKPRTGDAIVGVDLGIKAAATLSTGESIKAPKPLKKALRRLRIRQRSISRKLEAAKVKVGLKPKQRIPKGTKIPVSLNRKKASEAVARLHVHIASIRKNFLHKITTRICRENQTIVIEDLNVAGMLKNDKLSRAISDIGFGEFRRQLEYKKLIFGNDLIIADRWFPSSKLCSVCGWKNDALQLKDREWVCHECGTIHDRDVNAAVNLEQLPVASSSEGENVGKDTPVSYEPRPVRNSERELTVNTSVHF
jgi:putative transposase